MPLLCKSNRVQIAVRHPSFRYRSDNRQKALLFLPISIIFPTFLYILRIIYLFYCLFERGNGRLFIFIIKMDQHIHRDMINQLCRQRAVDARGKQIAKIWGVTNKKPELLIELRFLSHPRLGNLRLSSAVNSGRDKQKAGTLNRAPVTPVH